MPWLRSMMCARTFSGLRPIKGIRLTQAAHHEGIGEGGTYVPCPYNGHFSFAEQIVSGSQILPRVFLEFSLAVVGTEIGIIRLMRTSCQVRQ